MKLPRWFDGMKRRLAVIRSSFDRKDSPAIQFILGLSLLGYGASQVAHGLGPIIVGGILVITAQPLIRWIK